MGEVPICLITALPMSVQVPLSALNIRGSICPPPTPNLPVLCITWGREPIYSPCYTCFDPWTHVQMGNFTSHRTLAALPPSQALTWVSWWPCMEPLPSFEAVVTAAAVLPDARPTGLECFPALPGILSPLGFSMIPVSCSSGCYCQCLKSCPGVTLQASWWCTSSSIVTHLGEKSTKKSDWEWVGRHGPGTQKAMPSPVLTALEESEPFISSPIKQRWYFPHLPSSCYFFSPSISEPKLKLRGAIK